MFTFTFWLLVASVVVPFVTVFYCSPTVWAVSTLLLFFTNCSWHARLNRNT